MNDCSCHVLTDFMQVAWHMGHPLSQTLFTSMYIDRLLWPVPKTLAEASFTRDSGMPREHEKVLHVVLRAYCLTLIKTCDLVHKRINQETYYEVRGKALCSVGA